LLNALLALPAVAQARLDNSPAPWPGAGMCDVWAGDHLMQCAYHGSVAASAKRTTEQKR
jgi:hypothetical protein